MSLSNFNTPSPIAVALDLYVADVRFAVSDRTDTIVEVPPQQPEQDRRRQGRREHPRRVRRRHPDAEHRLQEAPQPVRQLQQQAARVDRRVHPAAHRLRRPRRGRSSSNSQSDGALGAVVLKTDVGAVRLRRDQALNASAPASARSASRVSAAQAEVQQLQRSIRVGAADGTAERAPPRQREGASRRHHGPVPRTSRPLQRLGLPLRPRAVRPHHRQLPRRGAECSLAGRPASRCPRHVPNGRVEVGVREGSRGLARR